MCERHALVVALPNSAARETHYKVAIPISELPRSRAEGLTCMKCPALSGRACLVLGLCCWSRDADAQAKELSLTQAPLEGLSWNPAGKAQEDEPVEAATNATVV